VACGKAVFPQAWPLAFVLPPQAMAPAGGDLEGEAVQVIVTRLARGTRGAEALPLG
jgi:hypothetical protein